MCRDRAGIKPLFYAQILKKFFFASEIKALFSVPFLKKDPNKQAIYNYFGLKNIPNPLTAFKNIYQVRPGEIITLSENNIKRNFFWDLPQKKTFYKKKISAISILEKLDKAVKKQMRSDVEVGCFLSGGLDSSAIAKIAAKYTNKKLKTFSIVYEDKIKSKNLDNILSKKMSKLINSEHHEFNINYKNLKKELDNSLNCFDQPFAGTTSSYFLSKMTSKYVKVALSGDGADELFGSYIFPRLCEAKKIWSNEKLRKKFLKNSADVENNFINFDKINQMKLYEIKDYFMSLNEYDKKLYLNQNRFPKSNNIDYFKKIFNKYRDESDLTNLALKIDFKSLLPDQVLSFVDILSMNSSLEIRPPFLDNEMINLAFKINGSEKIIDSNPKIILKKSLSKILPQEVVNRKKEGFVLPIEDMYIKKNIKIIKDTLSKKNLNKHSYLDFEQVNKLIENINKNSFYENNKIWIFYCFQTWWNKNF